MPEGSRNFAGKNEFPFAVGKVEGFRAWRLGDSGQLWPLHVKFEAWRGGENIAGCYKQILTLDSNKHESPHEDCTCGFYAYHDRIPPIDMAYAMIAGPIVVGRIEGYGKTLIGDKGFRCEKARIVSIDTLDHLGSTVVNRIERRYPDTQILSTRLKVDSASMLLTYP
jgi:hypothetical protein